VIGRRKYVVKLKDVEEFGGVRLVSRISLAERAVEEQKERKIKIERKRERERERERERKDQKSVVFSANKNPTSK